MKRLITRMRETLADDRGFSLAEVMTVSLLLAAVLGSSYLAMGTVNSVSDGITARSTGQQQGQLAIEKMVRELRQGQVIYDTNDDPHRFAQLAGNVVSFYADIDHNGTVDRVTYSISNGDLVRTVAQSNKAAPTPTDFGSDSAPTKLCDLDPSVTSVFQYVDASSPPNVVTSDGQVNAVLITLSTVASSGGTTTSVTFPTTEVQVRAFPNS